MNPVPIKSYLMRAIHEWCSDHGYTPYLVVAVRGKLQVPMEYVKNGEIVLNVSYNATRNLHLGDDYVRFSARFGGVSRDIIVPIGAVVSLFAKESGEGMAWEPDPDTGSEMDAAELAPAGKFAPLRPVGAEETAGEPADQSTQPEDEPPPAPAPPPTGGRGHLRVVK